MAAEEQDTWLKALGVDVHQIRAKVEDVAKRAETVVEKGIDTVVDGAKQVYDKIGQAAVSTVQGVENAGGAALNAGDAALQAGGKALEAGGAVIKRAVKAFMPGAASGPMASDCKPVRGQVAGPPGHVLCATHGHILDINAKQIIASSLADYKAGRLTIGGGSMAAALIPGVGGIPGLPGLPGMPGPPGGGPVTGPFPSIPGGSGAPWGGYTPATPSGGTGPLEGVAKTVGKVVEPAIEGFALFDVAIVAGLLVVAGGVIGGLIMEVKSSEDLAALPEDVNKATAAAVAGYRAAIRNEAQPSDSPGKIGWLMGHDNFEKLRAQLAAQNPDALQEQILAAIGSTAEHGGLAAEPILRNKARESVWDSYASKHQDSKFVSYLSERFRGWSNIFSAAPQASDERWKKYLNKYSDLSSPLAGLGTDKDPRSAPGLPSSGPAVDPKTGKPLVAPGAANGGPAVDPNNPDPSSDPKADTDAPLEFTAAKLPPTADEFFERVRKQKGPVVFRNLSLDVMTTLKNKYGCDLAFGMQQMGTIGSYAALQIVVAGCGGSYQAHHIVEQKVLKHLGFPVDQCPAVILTASEHVAVSNLLAEELPPGDISELKRKEILMGYEKAYKAHPEWMSEVRRYLR